MEKIYKSDTGHYACTVTYSKTFPYVHFKWFNTKLFHYFCRALPFSFIIYFSLAYKSECQMGKLYKISTCAHTSMLRNEWIYFIIQKCDKSLYKPRMHTRLSREKCLEAAHHCSPDTCGRKRISSTG